MSALLNETKKLTAAHIALLAPVPREHLESALLTIAESGRVAFGSRAWELFRKLDKECQGADVDVYIYESYADGQFDPKVTWHGVYIRHVDAVGGAHPDGMKFRPSTTAQSPTDNSGYWAVFWELRNLEQLSQDKSDHVGTFTGFGNKKAYGNSFAAEGPLLIEHP